jgi:hypothetical protein
LTGKILGFMVRDSFLRGNLLSLSPHLFFKILAIEDIPFTATWRHVTRKRADLLTDYIVDMILLLEKIVQNPLGFIEDAPLVRKVCKIPFPDTVDD